MEREADRQIGRLDEDDGVPDRSETREGGGVPLHDLSDDEIDTALQHCNRGKQRRGEEEGRERRRSFGHRLGSGDVSRP
ncbi:MAG: hypothetical protein BroJett029_04000 [Alphaproteobacteria bacterium]|nr:MAG: hypothetical protein BroJett029_04000 [Alphaproteobacteria bacterium]